MHSLQQATASVPLALCAEYDSHMARHDSSSGATVKPITTTYMHIVSMEGSVMMIMNYIRKLPMIKQQLMQLPANGIPSPEQQPILKFYSLLLRIRTKPQQLLHLMTSETFLDEKPAGANANSDAVVN